MRTDLRLWVHPNLFLFLILCISPIWLYGESACPKPDGLSATEITETSAMLSWNANSEHLSFEIDVMHGQGTPSFKWSASSTEPSILVENLSPGSNYRFKVKASCQQGKGNSSRFEFTTKGEEEEVNTNGKCPKPQNLEVIELTDTSALLSWSGNTDHETYKVDLMQGQGTASFKWSTTTADTSILVEDLLPGSNYRFRVKASCEKGKGNSAWFNFTTTGEKIDSKGKCPKASNLAITEVTDTTVMLSWLGNEENAEYQVDVKSKNHTNSFNLTEMTSDTFLFVEALSPGGNYHFRIKANCSQNSGGSSSWIDFSTTGGDTLFQQCPKPVNLSVLEVTDTSALLTWISKDSVLNFSVDVKSGEQTPSYSLNIVTEDTFLLVDDLEPNGNYKFRVVAMCADTATSGSSDWSKFRTLPTPDPTNEEETMETALTAPPQSVNLVKSSEALSSDDISSENLNAYPNPADQEFVLNLPNEKLGYLTILQLTNLDGQIVFNEIIKGKPESSFVIPVASLKDGVYNLTIRSVNFSENRRILIFHK
jgi:hypothetical protein